MSVTSDCVTCDGIAVTSDCVTCDDAPVTSFPVTAQDGGRFDISVKQRLVIHNVTMNDTGFYTCIAYNTLAKAHARAYLTVLEGEYDVRVWCPEFLSMVS